MDNAFVAGLLSFTVMAAFYFFHYGVNSELNCFTGWLFRIMLFFRFLFLIAISVTFIIITMPFIVIVWLKDKMTR